MSRRYSSLHQIANYISRNASRFLFVYCVCLAVSLPCGGSDRKNASRFSHDGDSNSVTATTVKIDEPSQERKFETLMLQANDAMVLRDTNRALRLFEEAATQFGERPEAELGQVRAHLLAGDFRQAVAFANLVVGEHSDHAPAVALLALIEDRSGHTEVATSRLNAALQRWPDAASPRGALAEILIDRGLASKAIPLIEEWHARHPEAADILRLRARAALAIGDEAEVARWRLKAADAYAAAGQLAKARAYVARSSSINHRLTTADKVKAVRLDSDWPPPEFDTWPLALVERANVGNGVVIDGGRRIATDAALAFTVGMRAVVRNGLGAIRTGQVERRDEQSGTAVLLLERPYDPTASIPPARFRQALPGQFCFSLGFPVVADVEGGYPVLSSGIVVRTRMGSTGLMQITSWLSPDQRGAPLFDTAGNLIGIYQGKDDQVTQASQAKLGRGFFAAGLGSLEEQSQTSPSKPSTRSTDELYQELLPAVVEVVVVR